jgi:hypothetical protein
MIAARDWRSVAKFTGVAKADRWYLLVRSALLFLLLPLEAA